MFDINAAIDELRAFEGDEETPKPSNRAIVHAKLFAMWARHHGFEITSINADAMGGTGVYVRGEYTTEVWYCYLNGSNAQTIIGSAKNEGPIVLPDRLAAARYLRGEPYTPTLPQFMEEYVERYWEVQESSGRRVSLTDKYSQRHYLEYTVLCILLDTLMPELLKLAGNGLPLNGKRRIRKALGLPEDEKKDTSGR